jgi:hypothetical protein
VTGKTTPLQDHIYMARIAFWTILV